MKILLMLAFVAILGVSAYAKCQETETIKTFLGVVKVCDEMPWRIRFSTPVLNEACAELESSAAIIGARMAAGGPGACAKANESMKRAIKTFRAAVNASDGG